MIDKLRERMALAPIISSILYLVGGQWWKPARWFMGLPISLIYIWGKWTMESLIIIVLTTAAYWIATSAFPYGEDSWLNFLGEELKFVVCGIVFGIASFAILSITGMIFQAVISGLCFWFIKVLDDNDVIKNPWVELLRGFCGTVMYFAV